MEASSVLTASSSSSSYCVSSSTRQFTFNSQFSLSTFGNYPFVSFPIQQQRRLLYSCRRSSPLRTSSARAAVGEVLEKSADSLSSPREMLPKIDKSGRFCSPRAARELALIIIYAACLEGSDPVRLFEKRINARREPGYEFNKASLTEYNHMSFGGPPVTAQTVEEEDELLRNHEKESAIEEEVLSAPLKLVYSKLILRFTRKLLVAVAEKWDSHVLVIDKVAPPNWKNKPAGRILEFCIFHLAMSEIAVLGTRHQIVINEAVDLAKRFCDGAAPRIINGCLRTFVKDLGETGVAPILEAKQKPSVDM
ncbi:uncharacterized protein LOC132271383 [Cornus florida]|uniref:uncharacterized protein LOC132271383 n=1 Tax=Cornus florida TaxID=4283 RepID=UPI00289CD0BF|nr:uncharacterized protein LOC132271383 [Cornus florida]